MGALAPVNSESRHKAPKVGKNTPERLSAPENASRSRLIFRLGSHLT